MHGNNAIRKADEGDGIELDVHSIFYTLQGEMPLMGRPAVFVRLAYCNLRCTWCDTEFEDEVKRMHVREIIAEIVRCCVGCKPELVVITGGEPLRQNITTLARMINDTLDLDVQVETAGTLMVQGDALVFGRVRNWIVVSPKTPKLNQDLLPLINAYRYILRHGEVDFEIDGLPCISTQRPHERVTIARPHSKTVPVYVSPCDDIDTALSELNLELCRDVALRYGYRLSIQLHKILNLP